jgi:hypothetical protein
MFDSGDADYDTSRAALHMSLGRARQHAARRRRDGAARLRSQWIMSSATIYSRGFPDKED